MQEKNSDNAGVQPASQTVWAGEQTRLDAALALSGLARSRSHAKQILQARRVILEGKQTTKPATVVKDGDLLQLTQAEHYVSRGAYKLLAALEAFNVSVVGKTALDVGASTGGFTQVLLEREAKAVIALDVGREQLAPLIRADSRVKVIEGFNARELKLQALQQLAGVTEPLQLLVGDLSFISLRLILPALARVAAPQSDTLLLIKPQFEVGRAAVKQGIVVSAKHRERAVKQVLECAAEHGFHTAGVIRSPIAGTHGNREYLVHFVRDTQALGAECITDIASLTGDL